MLCSSGQCVVGWRGQSRASGANPDRFCYLGPFDPVEAIGRAMDAATTIARKGDDGLGVKVSKYARDKIVDAVRFQRFGSQEILVARQARERESTHGNLRRRLLCARMRPSLTWLLVFVPVAIAVRFVPAWHGDVTLFVCAGLAIIPLAGLMGKATEALAAHVGEGVGGRRGHGGNAG